MKDYNRLLKECYNKKCKSEVKLLSKIQKNRNNKIEKLIDNYYNKKISKKEFITETKKIENYYYNQKKTIKLLQCQLDKCFEYAKNIIHQLSHKIKYDKKDIYLVDEYIKILKQHSYYNSTLIKPPENINTENYNNTINILNKLDKLLKNNKK
jgi:hypothetical protein